MSEELTAKQKKQLAEMGRLNPLDHTQTDYVKPGSKAHMALLGIEPCDKTDEHPYEYRLSDPTIFGPTATREFLSRVLEAKISQLEAGPIPEPQSKNRFEPGYAPEMWEPEE